jgi:protein-tyrosine phosphatase
MALVIVKKDPEYQKCIHEILPQIYLGNCDSLYFLEKYNIQSVVQIGTIEELSNYHKINLPSLKLNIEDSNTTNIKEYFEQIVDFINNAEKPLLIHCNAGVSRSVTLLSAYMISKGYTPEGALEKIQEIRQNIIYTCPKPMFLKQLKLFYQQNINKPN